MAAEDNKKLNQCVAYLTKVEIPVLKQTARKLSTLIENVDHLDARCLAHVIKSDPLMVVKLIRYLQQHRARQQAHQIMEVEQVLIMLGMDNALKNVSAKPYIEDLLGSDHREALVYLLKATHRAKVASAYAFDWAVRLHDLRYEEVRIAALLHDLAEMLMWCFAPKAMLQIKLIQTQNKTIRSQHIQEKVLGFPLYALQHALAAQWKLPELLIALMDDNHSDQQRVRNVFLAVNLARHAANGWDDAALPDDYEQIGQLLHLKPEEVMTIIGADK
ncbi:HD-like signal output (HDOD) domain, no enzymatic activity [Nitrosomonas sp. Nm51]|uniref:HDOD domain-containing protein n=1 Tax=Nitrosomonas sp. Nm51 TaxID=133720 RepID=UPI0008B4FB6C|nr:HDOD domain-containing protein [Nitrosomonas sp. Nm51]SER22276.1 HD-like signal output (HDOD) domain, no enzymatic activity [Nitrosomonas sp. Nm51]